MELNATLMHLPPLSVLLVHDPPIELRSSIVPSSSKVPARL